jgi:hypothetical protein
LKLFTGTEEIRVVDANVSCAEQYEESVACVRLFSDRQAQQTRTVEIARIEHKITELRRAMEQARIELHKMTLAYETAEEHKSPSKTGKRTAQKRRCPWRQTLSLVKSRKRPTSFRSYRLRARGCHRYDLSKFSEQSFPCRVNISSFICRHSR